MPKYDAFGREIGEDTLAGLGGSPPAAPRPAVPRPQRAASRAAAPRQSAPVQPAPAGRPEAPAASDAAARQALASQLRGALSQAQAARAAGSPPAIPGVRRSRGARGCLVAFVTVFAMTALAIAGLVLLVSNSTVESGPAAGSSGTIAAPHAKPPAGLGPGSLVRRAEFAAVLAKLRTSELRLTYLRLAPERIDAQLLTRDGRLRSVQATPGGALARLGPDSGPGFDSTGTIPFARLRPGAPQRLARRGAAKLGVPVARLQYLVPSVSGSTVTWAAYFPRGRYVFGDAAGRYQRSYP